MTIAVPQTKTEQTRKPREIEYPVRDDNPMAETDTHADLMMYAKAALLVLLRGSGGCVCIRQ